MKLKLFLAGPILATLQASTYSPAQNVVTEWNAQGLRKKVRLGIILVAFSAAITPNPNF
jgi:hypothetical protein